MSEDPDAGNPPTSFGQLLRHFRLTYHERFRRKYPDAPPVRVKLSALALIGCMTDAGHSITSGAYSEIEKGESLPRESERFIAIVSNCLLLNPREYERLTRQLAYDLVRTRAGEKTLEILLRRIQERDMTDETEEALLRRIRERNPADETKEAEEADAGRTP